MSGESPSRSLVIGTDRGIYRAPLDDIGYSRQVLARNRVFRVRRFGDALFAATRSGLFRSRDSGRTWTPLGIPRSAVYSVVQSPTGERLYAGTHPAHLYVSTDNGGSWRELEGFRDVPSRETWYTPRYRDKAHVRSLAVHPDSPDRVIAGVEVGGVLVSDDCGVSWTEHRAGLETERQDGLQYDVHHVLALSGDAFVVSCGGGLYRTRDAGHSWTRLPDSDRPYFREAFSHGGRLYAAATRGPWESEMDAVLFESDDEGETLEAVPYPGVGDEFVLAWAAADDADSAVFAGTHTGSVLRRADDAWTALGSVPARIRSLAVV
ncbi:BNR repeat-containing glycosyl hydrolase [Haloferax mucosum ATCC BAA-1512]|uniref:BNR repeat-containing glycosyl hydrolase n=1 Tax=Haloferax mucosum ATCC BAA-1512 TaxID=662479 RepID=M0IQH1_9EURY|nr:glycosyl hydrolase [Haloferax mucosum]ELZ98063.1 BNR repeat-containing glycosyl hydrolase [Haloferax mucosum ATCC BAA-1512]